MLDETRLLRLIHAYFDQELGSEEKRELECMLLGSARAREIFLDQADWHGLHRELALRQRAESLMNGLGESGETGKVIVFPWKKKAMAGIGIAACLLLGFWLNPFNRRPSRTVTGTEPVPLKAENVALLAQAVDVEWETGSDSFGVGSALPKGMLKIRKGTLRLDFYSGARVFLEGPATLDLISQDLARLENGKLTAHVPPPAEGFTILNDNLRVVDRGTEFGMSATRPGDCEVHVFNGEVELQGDIPVKEKRSLFEGKAVSIRQGKWEAITANRRSFADPATILRAAARETDARWEKWKVTSEQFSKIPGLIVHYDFERLEPNGQIVTNRAEGADDHTAGTIIGCEQTSGRWSRKSALGFAKTSDRVRFRLEGATPSLTMMAWVRVDSLPEDHNSLLSMAPGQTGEIHWKLDKAGSLLLGIRATQEPSIVAWERLVSPPVVTEQNFGRWMHFATVIDGEKGIMTHFVNGHEVTSSPMKRRVLLQLGMANLGNFDSGLPPEQDKTPVRSFNGRIDEFSLISRALTGEEMAPYSTRVSPVRNAILPAGE